MPRRKTTEEFISDAIGVHGDKYVYSQVDYVNRRTKVTIICPNHGPFKQTPANHLSEHGCPSCAGKHKSTTEEFIQKSKIVHADRYDYSRVEYVGAHSKVTIICHNHGPFEQTSNSHLSGNGCPHCAGNTKPTTEEFIQKVQDIHGDRYDYSQVDYVNNHTKVTIICPEHGPFEQITYHHLNGQGCPYCSVKKFTSTTEEFIQKAQGVHSDQYDYSSVDYVTNKTKVTIICPNHGPFEQIPNNHLNRQGCPSCNSSKGETLISNFLTTHNIRFIREYRFTDCVDDRPLPFDFYLPDHDMCIEFDGIQHFEPIEYFGGQEGLEGRQRRDNIKDAYCRDNNITLIRIPYTEDNISTILNDVLSEKCTSPTIRSSNTQAVPSYDYSPSTYIK